MTDDQAAAIERARSGDSESFQWLLERTGPPVYRLLVRLCRGHVHDAEDLYQATLMKVAEGMRGYRHQGSFEAWVFRIARNVFLDRQKKRRVDEAPLPERLPVHHDPGGRLLTGSFERALAEAVDGLTPKLREVFVLRHHAELSFKEIAEVLQAPLGTVLARMTYAMRALRPRLEGWRRERLGEVS